MGVGQIAQNNPNTVCKILVGHPSPEKTASVNVLYDSSFPPFLSFLFFLIHLSSHLCSWPLDFGQNDFIQEHSQRSTKHG